MRKVERRDLPSAMSAMVTIASVIAGTAAATAGFVVVVMFTLASPTTIGIIVVGCIGITNVLRGVHNCKH